MEYFEIENIDLYCKINEEWTKIATSTENAEVEITPEFIF